MAANITEGLGRGVCLVNVGGGWFRRVAQVLNGLCVGEGLHLTRGGGVRPVWRIDLRDSTPGPFWCSLGEGGTIDVNSGVVFCGTAIPYEFAGETFSPTVGNSVPRGCLFMECSVDSAAATINAPVLDDVVYADANSLDRQALDKYFVYLCDFATDDEGNAISVYQRYRAGDLYLPLYNVRIDTDYYLTSLMFQLDFDQDEVSSDDFTGATFNEVGVT